MVFLVIIQEIIFGIINCFEGRHIIIPWEYLILTVDNQKDDSLGHTPQAWWDQHSRKTTFHQHDESAAWTVLVDHVYHDHASILKFIEYNWKLKPLSARSCDRLPNPVNDDDDYIPENQPAIGNLTSMFDFSR
jgi:hypothetical protein